MDRNIRNRLSRVVLDEEARKAFQRVQRAPGVTKLKEFKISRAQFIYLSMQIEELFVGENHLTYYTPFKYVDKEKCNAHGTLVRHHDYLVDEYRKQGLLEPCKPSEDESDVHAEIPGRIFLQ